VSPLETLRELAERLPAGFSLTATREALLEVLGPGASPSTAAPAADLTVADIAARLTRAPSTVRGWLEAGRFAGAYKLNGRDWRLPVASLATFLEEQRSSHGNQAVRLDTWRRGRRRAGAP
jgi:helix-turn-helix protein